MMALGCSYSHCASNNFLKAHLKNVMTLGNLTTFFFFFYVRHIIIIRKKSGGQIWPSAVPVKHHRLQIKVVMTRVLGSEVAQW